MTTETTCLSSIWRTDDKIKEFYDIHGRSEDYKELNPDPVAYYDGVVRVELDKITSDDRDAVPSEQCLYDRGSQCKP